MNNHQKGYRRVREIVEAVDRCGVLDAVQIELLIYGGRSESNKRQAQRKLQKLHKLRRLNRGRVAVSQPYHYYTGKAPGQPEHRLATNWIYLWMLKNLKNWETLHSFDYEPDYKLLRADALASVKNKVTGKFLFYFIEADLSHNPFDKVKKYNDLYASERYAGSWWVNLADRFPAVIVATESESRLKAIQKAVDEENVHGLEFRAYLLDHLKEVCRGCPANSITH